MLEYLGPKLSTYLPEWSDRATEGLAEIVVSRDGWGPAEAGSWSGWDCARLTGLDLDVETGLDLDDDA